MKGSGGSRRCYTSPRRVSIVSPRSHMALSGAASTLGSCCVISGGGRAISCGRGSSSTVRNGGGLGHRIPSGSRFGSCLPVGCSGFVCGCGSTRSVCRRGGGGRCVRSGGRVWSTCWGEYGGRVSVGWTWRWAASTSKCRWGVQYSSRTRCCWSYATSGAAFLGRCCGLSQSTSVTPCGAVITED